MFHSYLHQGEGFSLALGKRNFLTVTRMVMRQMVYEWLPSTHWNKKNAIPWWFVQEYNFWNAVVSSVNLSTAVMTATPLTVPAKKLRTCKALKLMVAQLHMGNICLGEAIAWTCEQICSNILHHTGVIQYVSKYFLWLGLL